MKMEAFPFTAGAISKDVPSTSFPHAFSGNPAGISGWALTKAFGGDDLGAAACYEPFAETLSSHAFRPAPTFKGEHEGQEVSNSSHQNARSQKAVSKIYAGCAFEFAADVSGRGSAPTQPCAVMSSITPS